MTSKSGDGAVNAGRSTVEDKVPGRNDRPAPLERLVGLLLFTRLENPASQCPIAVLRLEPFLSSGRGHANPVSRLPVGYWD